MANTTAGYHGDALVERLEELNNQKAARIVELEKALAPLVSPFAYGEPSKWNDDAEIDCCVTITYGDVARARHAMEKKL